jgi:hypothetical protein
MVAKILGQNRITGIIASNEENEEPKKGKHRKPTKRV